MDTMLLETKALSKVYNKRSVVSNLSFSVGRGEIVGLLGPNGAGKTTAFYITIGLIRPDSGRVLFQDEDITELPIHKRAKRGMGYLAQEPSVFRNMSVEDNLLTILETLKLSKDERYHRLDSLLEELHLTSLRNKIACTLSGGERRRLEITRSLITNPSLLLLDEPFANVDPITVSEMKTLIAHLKSKGISVLITDHNARELSSVVDRSYLIKDGTVFMTGTSEELMASEMAQEAYFGKDFRL